MVWFRGEASLSFKLLPSLLRPPCSEEKEQALIKRFRQNSVPFMEEVPRTEWEWLFLMQHYGVQTRLMDWTEHPLVALYFAASDKDRLGEDGRLWCLLPKVYNKATHHIALTPAADILCFDVDTELELFLPSQIGMAGSKYLPPIAAIASQKFNRIYAQHGVFTVFHRNVDPLEKQAPSDSLKYFVIPAKAKANIVKELITLKIDKLALFPDLNSVAEKVKQLV
ncbi:MAG: FRG domain-containing protein [Prosthecobacter sp.]|nr:FRG domain-containing protein [Prosthecobacter sp.]